METLLMTCWFAVAAASMPGLEQIVKTFFAKTWACSEPLKQTGLELCFVVPTTKDLGEMHPDDVHARFVPPGRRCRLTSINRRDWGGILVPTDTARSKPLHTLEAVVTESVKGIRAAEEVRHIEDRMYNDEMLIVEIPPEERPDPEVHRIHNADIEL
ncbi:hypothetical protein G3M48_010105 [Beauveria asiatica]|uniref:Uncharacterized protein n=1 Tax=Beauveria asiatica TaxID=1069075 RepID=A0AAW0RHU9_9HYPO